MVQAEADADEEAGVHPDIGEVIEAVAAGAHHVAQPGQFPIRTVEKSRQQPQPAAPPHASLGARSQGHAGSNAGEQAQ